MTAQATPGTQLWPPGAGAAQPGLPPDPGGPGADLDSTQFRAAAREIFRGLAASLAQVPSRDEARPIVVDATSVWASRFAQTGGALVSRATHDRLVQAVLDEGYGLGRLQPYVDDPEVENININGPHQVWLELRGGGKRDAGPIAGDDAELIDMVRQWGRRPGHPPREFSSSRPMMTAAIGPGIRLSAVMAVTRTVHVSVRCHRQLAVTLDDLTGPGYQTLTPGLAGFLRALIGAHKNIIVTGGANAGKTTLLRSLAGAIDPHERVAVLESVAELGLGTRLQDVVELEAREPNSEGAGAVTLYDMIPLALRLDPRRIVVGEVLGTEMGPMLEAMNTGHPGSMATVHANSAGEVFDRILMLAQRAHLAMTAEAILLAVGLARPFVVHLSRDPHTGGRYVSEVSEVTPIADGTRPARNRVFRPGPDGRAQFSGSLSDEAARDLAAAGLQLGAVGR